MLIKLGDRVKDTITGFTGVVICISQWLHGCRRITLQPEQLINGKMIESQTFDEPQLKVVKGSVTTGESRTGGPKPEPSQKVSPK